MKPHRNLWKAMGVAAISLLALNSCVVTPGPDPYYSGGTVIEAPPPPRVEVIGAAPYPNYVWIDGYWGWRGQRHEWVPGRWEAPRAGHHWRSHRWERDGQGWRERQGYWERD